MGEGEEEEEEQEGAGEQADEGVGDTDMPDRDELLEKVGLTGPVWFNSSVQYPSEVVRARDSRRAGIFNGSNLL